MNSILKGGSVMIHCIPVKNRYLMMMARREKTVEVHLLTRSFKRIKRGDIILFFDSRANIVRALVKDIRVYNSLDELLKNEELKRILPIINSPEEFIAEFERIYYFLDKSQLRRRAFIAIEVQIIDYIPGVDENMLRRLR